jgi:hypothetical protein
MILRDGQRELGVTPVNAVSPPLNDVSERRSDRCRSVVGMCIPTL